MNSLKGLLYVIFLLIGIVSIIVGSFPKYIETHLLPKHSIIIKGNWLKINGIIFASVDFLLLIQEKYNQYEIPYTQFSYIEIFLIIILFTTTIFASGWLYGQYGRIMAISTKNIENIKEQLAIMNTMENRSPFYFKKVIIRDDDVGNFSNLQSLRWLSDLCIEKNFKITYACTPAQLISKPDTIDYLNTLDRSHFEFATHGYEHISFRGLSYDEQYSLIENSTKIIGNNLKYRPFTFVPPYGSGDKNTTKACKFLGYHSITDVFGYSSYLINFISDFSWEVNYDPVSHHTFIEFKKKFDIFLESSQEYYFLNLHDWTFLNKNSSLDKKATKEFEKSIDYINAHYVQFFTIEEAYRWRIDNLSARTYGIDKQNYGIDLTECRYNHKIKFRSPWNVNESITVTDMSTKNKVVFSNKLFEFDGLKGHWYIISIPDN